MKKPQILLSIGVVVSVCLAILSYLYTSATPGPKTLIDATLFNSLTLSFYPSLIAIVGYGLLFKESIRRSAAGITIPVIVALVGLLATTVFGLIGLSGMVLGTFCTDVCRNGLGPGISAIFATIVTMMAILCVVPLVISFTVRRYRD